MLGFQCGDACKGVFIITLVVLVLVVGVDWAGLEEIGMKLFFDSF